MNDDKETEWQSVKKELSESLERMSEIEAMQKEANIGLTSALKRLRVHYNLSQEQVANIMGVSPMYISLLERGKRPWSHKSLRRLIDPLFQL
jgi:predicted transcriptional regulator